MANVTQIPAPRVDLIDPRTGLMAREWFRFFNNLFVLTGGGTTDVTLADLQLAPEPQTAPPDATAADLAPQTVVVIEPQLDLAPRDELGTLASQNADNVRVGALTASGAVSVSGALTAFGALLWGSPVTKTADFTLADTESWIINNKAGSTCVATLPAASAWTGRVVTVKTIQAQLVNSASANVVPLIGGAAGTAILAATAGKWATLVSDGSNWVIMAGN